MQMTDKIQTVCMDKEIVCDLPHEKKSLVNNIHIDKCLTQSNWWTPWKAASNHLIQEHH